MKKILLILVILLACLANVQADVFKWTNPISSGINSGGLRDCYVFRANGKWYLTGTSSPHWGDGYGNPGVRLYRSNDLINWQEVGLIVKNPGTSKWYASRFWAPEVAYIKGKYYCTFNCRNERDGFSVKQSWGVAVADNVEGPYTVLSDQEPVSRGNDVTLFEDEDGQVYAAWCGASPEHPDGNVMTIGKIDLNTLKMTDVHEIFGGGSGDVATTGWDKCGVEGPAMFKRNGKYYMMYSSWQRGYEVGVATATNPMGTWTKSKLNPLFGAQSKSKWADAVEGDWQDLGHNTVFTGPDGGMWLSCHGQLRGGGLPPMLVIQPMKFDANGDMQKMDIPHNEQQVISGTKLEAEANDGNLVKWGQSPTSGITVKASANNTMSGGQYVGYLGMGNYIEFKFTPATSGLYLFNVAYATGQQRMINISVNGTSVGVMTCNPTGGWTVTAEQQIASLPMKAGKTYVIRLYNDTADMPNLDYVSLALSQAIADFDHSFFIKNVGTGQWIKTGGLSKNPDSPILADQADRTANVIVKQADGTYTIADPEFAPAGWGVQGRNTIYESNNGSVKTNSWGTTLIPGFKFVSTGDNDGSVYIEYTWGQWTAGKLDIADPSNKTYALYYGDWALGTDNWSDAQKTEVANASVYSDLKENVSSHGANAKWLIVPLGDGIVDVTPAPQPEVPVPATVTVSLPNYGQGTFSSGYALDFSNSPVKAYVAAGYNAENGTLLLARAQEVPAGTGLLLKGTQGDWQIPVIEQTNWTYCNMFEAVVEGRNVSAGEGEYVNYCLADNGTNKVAFYRIEGSVGINANRAYLQVPASLVKGEAARVINYVFEDETTGIEAVNSQSEKRRAQYYYDLQGRQVKNPVKGIYMNNTRKVVVR